ncbi:PhzF family phenazine biosynthesis protein [Burkholderia multivorans]|uniref:PhzF family phenazine biosynthesis protein n=1 Tax=Burkholderia multivorans TaxID=87883 RepID=UPI0009C1627B|nr:PhzF family phenazine biosynthesis protein [Burkholderia multivorans]
MLLQYCVKAFSTSPLDGNPAAIIILKESLCTSKMQRIAFINGFPETVYIIPHSGRVGHYSIRWFTPFREVIKAGHATLAAQFVLASISNESPDWSSAVLHWIDPESQDEGEEIFTRNESDRLRFGSLPSFDRVEVALLPNRVEQMWRCNRDLVLVMETEDEVMQFKAPLDKLANLPFRGLCITARSNEHDYCNRFFAPAYGVPEDYVTASAHHYLAVYWANKLGKPDLVAIQHSMSPGVLRARVTHDSVEIRGNCHLFSTSNIYI